MTEAECTTLISAAVSYIFDSWFPGVEYNIIIKSSTDHIKGSLHVILNSATHCWSCIKSQKPFWLAVNNYLNELAPETRYLHTAPDSTEHWIPNQLFYPSYNLNGVFNGVHCVVDMAIYTTNRSIRTLLSHKIGDIERTFKLKSDNVFLDSILSVQNDDKILLDKLAIERDLINDEDPLPQRKDKHSRLDRIKQKRTRVNIGNQPNLPCDSSIGSILKFISVNHDDLDFVPLSFNCRNNRIIDCQNKCGVRVCLIHGEENHSDNCYLLLKNSGIYCRCFDEGCQGEEYCMWSFSELRSNLFNKLPSTYGEIFTKYHIDNVLYSQDTTQITLFSHKRKRWLNSIETKTHVWNFFKILTFNMSSYYNDLYKLVLKNDPDNKNRINAIKNLRKLALEAQKFVDENFKKLVSMIAMTMESDPLLCDKKLEEIERNIKPYHRRNNSSLAGTLL